MKTHTHTARSMALAAFIFASIMSGCKKSGSIQPQIVSKPKSITTTANGAVIRQQLYTYDSENKLKTYVSMEGGLYDSIKLIATGFSIRRMTMVGLVREGLSLNDDNTYRNFNTAYNGLNTSDFRNNGTQLQNVLYNSNGIIEPFLRFSYIANHVGTIASGNGSTSVTYYEELAYQKGINELPFDFSPIKYYKLLEQEGVTSTILYNRLIKEVAIHPNAQYFQTHQYGYTFDDKKRVVAINEHIIDSIPGLASRSNLLHSIQY